MEKPKIIIVDDEAEPRESIKKYLSRYIECDIKEASDGRQALEMIDEETFDIMLLDVKMPGISGIDVLKRTRVTSPQTDIIIITAYDSQQIAKEALSQGAVDYIVKPSTIEVIFDKVRRPLEKKNLYLPKDPKAKTSN